jgi:hypothetical protein
VAHWAATTPYTCRHKGVPERCHAHQNMIASGADKSLSKTNDGLSREVWLALSAYQSRKEVEMSLSKQAQCFFSFCQGVGPVLLCCRKYFSNPSQMALMCYPHETQLTAIFILTSKSEEKII